MEASIRLTSLVTTLIATLTFPSVNLTVYNRKLHALINADATPNKINWPGSYISLQNMYKKIGSSSDLTGKLSTITLIITL